MPSTCEAIVLLIILATGVAAVVAVGCIAALATWLRWWIHNRRQFNRRH